jgi:hypothetical protein
MGMRRRVLPWSCVAIALCAGQPASAQEVPAEAAAASPPQLEPSATGDAPPPSGEEQAVLSESFPPLIGEMLIPQVEQRTIYTPNDFVRFAPRNALQMLQNVPGFTIEGQSQERGLGQASGNVLINGQRDTSKSDSITNQLSRIPAASVIRIELVDGSTLNIPGLSGRVANVVYSAGGGVSGRFEYRPQWSSGPAPFRWSNGDVSVSGKSGPLDFSVAVRNDSFNGGSEGPLTILGPLGVLDERYSRNRSTNDTPRASGSFKYDLGGGARANLNLSGSLNRFRSEEQKYRIDPAQPTFIELLNSETDGYGYEISGDVEFAFGPGQLKLIALESYDHSDFATRSPVSSAGRQDTGSQFQRGSNEGERIGRGEYRWRLWGADWQASLEAAFNRLGNATELFTLSPAGEYVPIPFPAGSGGVREDRYEGTLSYGRPLASNLSLQLTLGGEYSTLAQSGTNALSRSFKRPKGSLNLAWAPTDNLDVSLRVARRVGQLSFGDFLASVNLTDNNSNAGNNQLRPQQSWELELEGARDFGAWGSATVRLFHNRIQDYITIIPLLTGGESRGNIPAAQTSGVNVNATLRLDPIGVAGAKIDVRGVIERSRLEDPVTRLVRAFDRARAHEIVIDYRHDLPGSDWAYGGSFRQTRTLPYFRVTEIGLDYFVPRAGSLFVEHKDLMGLTVRLNVSNLFGGQTVLERSIFAGPRNTALLLYRENRYRDSGQTVALTISGSF